MGGALEENRASLNDLVVRLFAGNLVARGAPMILGGIERDAASDRTTLDDLFRRAGVRHPDAIALIDPPNRNNFTDAAPRRLTYAQADRAIAAFAGRLRKLGLQSDAVVAMQLPNTVESVIALLGVLRAGMIAAPLPVLWRKREMVAALRSVGAKAVVTAGRIGSTSHAELAAQVAAELFSIRTVCAFGEVLPDGVVPLDGVFNQGTADFGQPLPRSGNAAAHIAVVTFDVASDGQRPMARNHLELIAGGLGPYLESGAALDGKTLSAIPLGSFAGVVLTVVTWLLGGGTLQMHHAFDAETFTAQCRQQDAGTLILPGPALALLAQANRVGEPESIIALWRSPERMAKHEPWRGAARMVDAASFGEIGLLSALRGADGLLVPVPYGSIGAPRGGSGAITVIEALRTAAGTLALRGPMVPAYAFPPGAERGAEPHLKTDALGFIDTGFFCRLEREGQHLQIDGPPAGITSVGGYRFRQNDIDWLVADADIDAIIVALPDAILDRRLAGSAPDRAATADDLDARGANPLITGAFRRRIIDNAA
jgi:hypothetical protein